VRSPITSVHIISTGRLESTVTLFPLPTLSPPTPLVKAKAAFSFGIHSSVQYLYPNGKSDKTPEVDFNNPNNNPKPIPTIVTQLVVGCRRKVVIYSWKDGEPQEAKVGVFFVLVKLAFFSTLTLQEVSLPHSARVITFLNADTACFAYSPTEYAIFSISTMSAVDVVTPLPVTSSKGTLTGLTGYMTLGLGAKVKPAVVQARDSEALITKDSMFSYFVYMSSTFSSKTADGYFIGPDAKVSRPSVIEWPAPPEELG